MFRDSLTARIDLSIFSSGPTAAEKKLKQLAELLDRWDLVTLTYQTSRNTLSKEKFGNVLMT